MRAVVVLLALVLVVPALGDEPDPYVRDCSTSQFGDLGPAWRERAIVAGHLAFVGMKGGYRSVPAAPAGRASPLKVLVVVDPNAGPTVTIAPQWREYAALGYNAIRHNGTGVPLGEGTTSVRFRACRADRAREPWNRGTQFGGYFLVVGRRCVQVDVATQGRVMRRKLGFGARCA